MSIIHQLFNKDSGDNIYHRHPEFCTQLRDLIKEGQSGYCSYLFDYCDSWSFSRILMGWTYHKDPVYFYKVLSFVNDFFKEYYPAVYISVSHGDISFYEKSYYIDEPKLNALFLKEIEDVQRRIRAFDPALFNAYRELVKPLLKADSPIKDSVRKVLSSDCVNYFSIINNKVIPTVYLVFYESKKTCEDFIKQLKPFLPEDYLLILKKQDRGSYIVHFINRKDLNTLNEA